MNWWSLTVVLYLSKSFFQVPWTLRGLKHAGLTGRPANSALKTNLQTNFYVVYVFLVA